MKVIILQVFTARFKQRILDSAMDIVTIKSQFGYDNNDIQVSDKIIEATFDPVSASVFNIHRLPLEVRLEIFGCLAHAEWIRLASHNRRTGKVLAGNQRYLASIHRFYELCTVCLTFKKNSILIF
jgi:hypothetical protein